MINRKLSVRKNSGIKVLVFFPVDLRQQTHSLLNSGLSNATAFVRQPSPQNFGRCSQRSSTICPKSPSSHPRSDLHFSFQSSPRHCFQTPNKISRSSGVTPSSASPHCYSRRSFPFEPRPVRPVSQVAQYFADAMPNSALSPTQSVKSAPNTYVCEQAQQYGRSSSALLAHDAMSTLCESKSPRLRRLPNQSTYQSKEEWPTVSEFFGFPRKE